MAAGRVAPLSGPVARLTPVDGANVVVVVNIA